MNTVTRKEGYGITEHIASDIVGSYLAYIKIKYINMNNSKIYLYIYTQMKNSYYTYMQQLRYTFEYIDDMWEMTFVTPVSIYKLSDQYLYSDDMSDLLDLCNEKPTYYCTLNITNEQKNFWVTTIDKLATNTVTSIKCPIHLDNTMTSIRSDVNIDVDMRDI